MLIHYEASVLGAKHRLQGRDSQDHCCARVVDAPRTFGTAGDGGPGAESSVIDAAPRQAIVAAVAGGMPSMILSGEGAHLASEAAVDAAAEAYRQGKLVPGDASALKGVFERALRAVADAAVDQPAADITSFACTLCLVVWDGVRVWYGNAGDSGAVAVNFLGDPFALTHMHCGPLSSQPFPLHDSYHWEFGYRASAESVLVATGGMLGQFAEWAPGGFGIGAVINSIISFLITAFVVFVLVKAVNRLTPKKKEEEPKPEPPKGPTTEELLVEIRDLLKQQEDK